MARKKPVKKVRREADSTYFLKILLFFIIGSIWVRFTTIEVLPGVNGLPLGLGLGLLFAMHDHFQIDRKIEYAILLSAALVSYVAPVGIVLIV
jgi:hypothetical protein